MCNTQIFFVAIVSYRQVRVTYLVERVSDCNRTRGGDDVLNKTRLQYKRNADTYYPRNSGFGARSQKK